MTTAQGRGCVMLALVGVIAATPRRAPATDLTGTWRVVDGVLAGPSE